VISDRPDTQWWHLDHDDGLRRRQEKIVEQREPYTLETVDHGQVVGYDGNEPIETAVNGITGLEATRSMASVSPA
jgi:hypothetical protein